MIKELRSFKSKFIHAHVIFLRNDKTPHDAEHFNDLNSIPKVKRYLEVTEYNANESLLLVTIGK